MPDSYRHSYAVLIVNFNSASFTKKAVESVLRNATSGDFTIQIVDNNSQGEDTAELDTICDPRVFILKADRNCGFAVGNNLAATAVCNRSTPKYFVIMNPDTEIVQPGSIERLIQTVQDSGPDAAGAQPLIWDYRFQHSSQSQITIRNVPDYLDLVITESVVLRYVWRKRYRTYIRALERPYTSRSCFHVPSGAFFVINTAMFRALGGFDENTFLYGEELILGKKLSACGKYFVLEPSVEIHHFQGATTRFDVASPSRKMYLYRRDSNLYYARAFLGTGWMKRLGLRLVMEFGYAIRIVVAVLHRTHIWGKHNAPIH